jgi:hypothetical protein
MRPLARILRFVTVDSFGSDAGFHQIFHHLIGTVLGTGKYKRSLDVLILQNVVKQ